ncbi:MAG: hypothetical protein R3C29_03150 [Dehalococcoidia bacterium]
MQTTVSPSSRSMEAVRVPRSVVVPPSGSVQEASEEMIGREALGDRVGAHWDIGERLRVRRGSTAVVVELELPGVRPPVVEKSKSSLALGSVSLMMVMVPEGRSCIQQWPRLL